MLKLNSIINTKYNIIIEEDIDIMYYENYIKVKNSSYSIQFFCYFFYKKDIDVIRIRSYEIKCC